MATEIKMPQLGLTMEEGTVERWLKAEGDPVKAGEPLLEITTDKLTNEVAAETDGVLLKIVAQEGADVPVKGLLGYIGGKMLVDGIKGEEAEEAAELSAGALLMQGVATSIDALSVGFTISEYGWLMALAASLIIAVVTFFICMAGLRIGKKFGTKLSGKASILGGIILIGIGLEIFISGVF